MQNNLKKCQIIVLNPVCSNTFIIYRWYLRIYSSSVRSSETVFNSPLKAAVHSNFQGLCKVVHSNGKNFTKKAISEDEENKEPSLQQMKTAILLLSISP